MTMKPRDLSCCFLLFIQLGFSWSQEPSSDCLLNFTQYPYQPTGQCLASQVDLRAWGSLDIPSCCLNALNTLTQALALHASQRDTIFLSDVQWRDCNYSFPQQPSVSIDSCGFQKLYRGNGMCSGLSLSFLKRSKIEMLNGLVAKCSQFEQPTFEDSCRVCSQQFSSARDQLRTELLAKEQETGTCGVALAVALTSINYQNATWVRDFFRCLPALNRPKAEIVIKFTDPLVKVVLGIVTATIILMLVVVLIKYKRRKKPMKPTIFEASTCSGLYRFSKAEIENAMNFGSHKVSLGSGSAGRVYKGVLPSGQLVAIKHIYKDNMSDSFTREVEGLSRVRHANLVCLFGCCVEGGDQYLVYEYCSYGNLAQQLLRIDSVLTWERRVKILRDSALALRFLHQYPDGCIVHRDIKLTNILLTENMDPKLSDFGLAKMLGMHETKVFTDVRGTIGYMDPEYVTNAKLTSASDVYSFGIVALQLLSGRKVIELDLEARDNLTRKAKDVVMQKRPLSDIVDPRLNGEFDVDDFKSILHIAVVCVAKSSKGRPSMDQVFEELDKALTNTVDNIEAFHISYFACTAVVWATSSGTAQFTRQESGKGEANPSSTPQSRSLELIAV